MNAVFVLVIALIFAFVFISWIFPLILSWLFEKKFKVSVRIGRIGFPSLKLCNIQISKNGINIHIDEVCLKSSFLNSDLTKLITLVVKDVRINKDIGPNEISYVDNRRPNQTYCIDFREHKIPAIINNFAQFMAVHVYSISAILLRSTSPGGLMHATASELHLDGSIYKNAKTLLVSMNLMDATMKVLKHAEDNSRESCLAEFSFGIFMEAVLVAQGPLSVEKLHVKIDKSSAIINESFYTLAQSNNKENNAASIYSEDDNILDKIFPIIPKYCSLQIEDTSVKGVKESGQIEYHCYMQNLVVNYKMQTYLENGNKSYIVFNLTQTGVQLQNNKAKTLVMKTLKLESKVIDNIVNIYFEMDTLLITYIHEVIHKWLYNNFLRFASGYVTPEKTSKYKLLHKKENFIEKILKRWTINICAKFSQVSALCQFNGHNSSYGFKLVRLMVNQIQKRRGLNYTSYLPKLLLADRHWQLEVLLESFWWSFKEWSQDEHISKAIHVWGTPMYIGTCLVKVETSESSELIISLQIDTTQIEWSLELADYILHAVRCVKEYQQPKSMEIQSRKKDINIHYELNIMVAHFNCFFQSQNTEYFVCRLNSINFSKKVLTTEIQLADLKIFSLNNAGGYYTCMRTEDISNYKVFIKLTEIKQNNVGHGTETAINFLEDISIFWSTNIHLKTLLLVKDMIDFVSALKEELPWRYDNSAVQQKNHYKWQILGKFLVHVEISQRHYAKVSLDDVSVNQGYIGTSVHIGTLLIGIDGSDIFTINGLVLQPILDNHMIKQERLDNENFVLPWNKTWGLSIDVFKAVFPYQHSYAEAIQDEFISVFKWIKIIHGIKREPFTSDGSLPSDILINLKEFIFEMSDDPFEVKLRDNFQLLEDEYFESLKRQKVLKEKVSELLKVYMHLPAGKVEDLYARLKKRNAEVYVQRSKQILLAGPARTRLFASTMTNIQLMLLADPSIYGMANVLNLMHEIDHDSSWPEEGLEFSTLWCRVVCMKCPEWKIQLRDFPQPVLDIREWVISGMLIGAEQQAPKRAIRTVKVNLGEPFEPFELERGLLPMKFYHDFNCEIESYSYAFGPCWEPVIAQCNLSLEKIFPPSRDPSPPLPFWDRMRLLLHGRLTMVVNQLTVLLHASLDPYNTTEEMELTWNNLIMDWTNTKFIFKGDLNIFVRTASKYDDCQLLHLPNLKLVLGIKWMCLSDPNDHYNVIHCARDKVPEYSSNQVHDSFRAFRSQNVNLSIAIETKPIQNGSSFDNPTLVLYGSTLRWIENLKLILSGVTRPTKRGRIFNNIRPRKIQLSRHYKKIHFLMDLHKFQVCYWMSYAMQRGCELLGGRIYSSSEHLFSLIPIDDGLVHRPKAEFSVVYMTSDLNDSEIWLKSALQDETESNPENVTVEFRPQVEKCYCLSVAKVSYGRESLLPNLEHGERNKDVPTHRLVVYDLKGAWTKSNRNVAVALFDTFMKNKQMKKNLSTEALKGFRKDNNTTPLKRRNAEAPGTPPNSNVQGALQTSGGQDSQSGQAANMLQQLIAEAETNTVVYSDDLSAITREQHLQGLQACQEDDVLYKNWQISLVNAQVLLKGCETKGYVIMSAAKSEIIQRVHRPSWKDRTLVSKTTWTGLLECMQYYATVNERENDGVNENIMWLTIDNIQEKESTQISEPSEVPNMVGSGVSVGAVVSDTVGPTTSSQLQRIVSRCKCEFFYANYGDTSIDPDNIGEVPPPPQENVEPWDRKPTAVDAFTLMHHDLDVCTNSLQYAMLLDIVNNLLLYVEPHRKEALERLARMRFQIQLHSIEDQRRPIQNQQTLVRTTVSKLRRLEKDSYLVSKVLAEHRDDPELVTEMNRLLIAVNECKNQLNGQSEELDMMLSCYKQSQLLASSRLATTRSNKPLTVVRANEICFKHAQWRLTETDGQIGIADLVLINFLYTKKSNSDDSVEHLLELGYLRMMNLLPNEIYEKVIYPTEIQDVKLVEHKKVLRIFCREKPPVGGISVKEHFEINLVPLTIGLTKKFYNTMMKFCFPEREADSNDYPDRYVEDSEVEPKSEVKNKTRKSGRKNRDSNFYVPIDDVEKMKERAEKNKLFVYIKIPEVPVKVSYKGSKEKNLEDLRDISLIIPTLEYHNMTLTWLDLLMAIRSDSKRVILSQAIKQKLQIKRSTGSLDDNSAPHEEDKARMLFGNRHAPENRSLRKGVFKFGK